MAASVNPKARALACGERSTWPSSGVQTVLNGKRINSKHQRQRPNHAGSSTKKTKAKAHLNRWLRLIVSPDEVTEVFVKERERDGLDIKPNFVGYYDSDHHDQLADDAISCSGRSTGVYYRMNPVASALLGRSKNRIQHSRYADSARAEDIVRRRLLMVDVDPIDSTRPSGVSASDSERAHARSVMDAVLEFLTERRWSQPAVLDTGNGYSLFYGIDLPADDDGLVRRVLEALNAQLGNEKARVDTTVHDPARLARLPGTKNCKGDPLDDRPHRLCRVLRWPRGRLESVPRQLLEELAKESPVPIGQANSKRCADPAVLAQARVYIAKMPGAIAGEKGHNATFSVACRLVIDFDLAPDEAFPLMLDYNGRCKPPWSEAELRRKLDEANQLDEPRGKLRIGDGVASVLIADSEPLPGPEFLGFVPDFADAGAGDVLDGFKLYEVGNRRPWFLPRLFLVWQMQRTDVMIPYPWLRQFIWGGRWPRNWRSQLQRRLNVGVDRGRPTRCQFDSAVCPLSGTNVRHRHVIASSKATFGLLESFAESPSPNGHREFRLHDDANKELKRELRKQGALIRAYWPGLLFGRGIGWTVGQQRLLQGIVYELTRPHGRTHRQHLVSGGRVITAGTGTHLVKCPLLDPQRKYVVFGGNGRRRGRGYQIVGRTSKGWLHRAGFPAAPNRGSPDRIAAISILLDNLEVLARDLDLVVTGYHARRREWKDISQLKDCVRTGFGQDWLEECTVRIFAPDDWLLRWRYFFSKRMGFRWIPAFVDDHGPFRETQDCETDESKRLTREDIRRWLRKIGWTQEDLARALGCSRRSVNRYLTGTRWTTDFAKAVEALMGERNETA